MLAAAVTVVETVTDVTDVAVGSWRVVGMAQLLTTSLVAKLPLRRVWKIAAPSSDASEVT